MKRIVIVEDDDDIRELFQKKLERAGYGVSIACNGVEASRLYKNESPDLVITDIIMPEKDGVEVIMELKKDLPEVKILAISGGGCKAGHAVDFLNMAEGMGVDLVLAKPINPDKLLDEVKKLLA